MNLFKPSYRTPKVVARTLILLGCLLNLMSLGAQAASRGTGNMPEVEELSRSVDSSEEPVALLAADIDKLTARAMSDFSIGSATVPSGGATNLWYPRADLATRNYVSPSFGIRVDGAPDDSFSYRNATDFSRAASNSSPRQPTSRSQCEVQNNVTCAFIRADTGVESDLVNIGRIATDDLAGESDADLPEPGSIALVGLALLTAGLISKRRVR